MGLVGWSVGVGAGRKHQADAPLSLFPAHLPRTRENTEVLSLRVAVAAVGGQPPTASPRQSCPRSRPWPVPAPPFAGRVQKTASSRGRTVGSWIMLCGPLAWLLVSSTAVHARGAFRRPRSQHARRGSGMPCSLVDGVTLLSLSLPLCDKFEVHGSWIAASYILKQTHRVGGAVCWSFSCLLPLFTLTPSSFPAQWPRLRWSAFSRSGRASASVVSTRALEKPALSPVQPCALYPRSRLFRTSTPPGAHAFLQLTESSFFLLCSLHAPTMFVYDANYPSSANRRCRDVVSRSMMRAKDADCSRGSWSVCRAANACRVGEGSMATPARHPYIRHAVPSLFAVRATYRVLLLLLGRDTEPEPCTRAKRPGQQSAEKVAR